MCLIGILASVSAWKTDNVLQFSNSVPSSGIMELIASLLRPARPLVLPLGNRRCTSSIGNQMRPDWGNAKSEGGYRYALGGDLFVLRSTCLRWLQDNLWHNFRWTVEGSKCDCRVSKTEGTVYSCNCSMHVCLCMCIWQWNRFVHMVCCCKLEW